MRIIATLRFVFVLALALIAGHVALGCGSADHPLGGPFGGVASVTPPDQSATRGGDDNGDDDGGSADASSE